MNNSKITQLQPQSSNHPGQSSSQRVVNLEELAENLQRLSSIIKQRDSQRKMGNQQMSPQKPRPFHQDTQKQELPINFYDPNARKRLNIGNSNMINSFDSHNQLSKLNNSKINFNTPNQDRSSNANILSNSFIVPNINNEPAHRQDFSPFLPSDIRKGPMVSSSQVQTCSFEKCFYHDYNKAIQLPKAFTFIPCKNCGLEFYHTRSCMLADINHLKNCRASHISSEDLSRQSIPKEQVSTRQEKYLINEQRLLGSGSFGNIYYALDLDKQVEVAIKFIDKEKIVHMGHLDYLKQEIRILKKMDHPHIIQLFDFYEDENNAYLVFQYADQGNLANYLFKKNFLEENEAFVYFFQTLLGVHYLHKMGVIHRDLKPENLLLDNLCNIRICDFGWSVRRQQHQYTRQTFCGTLAYMAPEVAQGKEYSYSADIWSLGAILYQLLHGTLPQIEDMDSYNINFKGNHDQQKGKTNEILFRPSLSSNVKQLIVNMLGVDPKKRYCSEQIFKSQWVTMMTKHFNINISDLLLANQEYVNESLKKAHELGLNDQVQVEASQFGINQGYLRDSDQTLKLQQEHQDEQEPRPTKQKFQRSTQRDRVSGDKKGLQTEQVSEYHKELNKRCKRRFSAGSITFQPQSETASLTSELFSTFHNKQNQNFAINFPRNRVNMMKKKFSALPLIPSRASSADSSGKSPITRKAKMLREQNIQQKKVDSFSDKKQGKNIQNIRETFLPTQKEESSGAGKFFSNFFGCGCSEKKQQ